MDPYFSIIAGFVSAVLAGIAIKMIIREILRPELVIDGNEAIIVKDFKLLDPDGRETIFKGNRIRVRNAGKSAARDYKAYICYSKNDVERAVQYYR
jgi:hypothetical protein